MKIHAAEALALLTLCSVTTVLALPGVPAKAAVRSSAETETLPFSEAARLLADKYRITLVAEGPAPLGQRLLSEMEPRFNKPGAKSALPVADLDSASRSALAIVLMEPLLKNLTGSLKQQGPDYIAGFDQLYLNGGTYEKDGQTMVRLYLEVRDPATNRLLNSVGIADVKVPPPPQPQ